MKWNKNELDRLKFNSFHYSEDADIDISNLPSSISLKSLNNVHIEGEAKYDSYLEALTINLLVTGVMIIPCSRTLQDVDYQFKIIDSVTYSFNESEDPDAILVKGNTIDTDEYIHDLIICEIPQQVFAEGSTKVEMKEEKQLDPRLAILKELNLK